MDLHDAAVFLRDGAAAAGRAAASIDWVAVGAAVGAAANSVRATVAFCAPDPISALAIAADPNRGRVPFRDEFTHDRRVAYARELRRTHPDSVPVIVERTPGSMLPPLPRRKYLVRDDTPVAQVIQMVRARSGGSATHALFLTIATASGGAVPLVATSESISAVYQRHANPDGFLYLNYREEAVFGR